MVKPGAWQPAGSEPCGEPGTAQIGWLLLRLSSSGRGKSSAQFDSGLPAQFDSGLPCTERGLRGAPSCHKLAPLEKTKHIGGTQSLLVAPPAGPASQRSLSSLSDASFLRQMRRGMLGLARAIAVEALGLGAFDSLQSVLNQRRVQAPAVLLQ